MKARREVLIALCVCVALAAGCGAPMQPVFSPDEDGPPDTHIDVAAIPNATPRVEPRSQYGNPESYEVNGQRYHTWSSSSGYVERGIASWYGKKFHGRRTSSGEPYNMYAMTAAHKQLPLPSYVEVTNLSNGRSIVVRVNDRGPFHPNRIIDLSYAAARKLDMFATGTALVEVRAVDPKQPARPQQVKLESKPRPTEAQNVSMYIQLGAFSNRSNAEQVQAQLGNTFPTLHISTEANQERTLYRVRIGPLASVEEADRLSTRLFESGVLDARVVID